MCLKRLGFLQIPIAIGLQGPAGASVLNGTTNPGSGTGQNGDFYINTVTNTIFGPKASGVWPAGVSLTGPPGAAVLNGTTNPTGSTGLNGDFYINTATNTLFGPKSGGTWPAGVSLVGPAGTGTSIIYSAGAQAPQTASSGVVTLRPAFNIAAGEWLQNDGDVAKFITTIRAIDPSSPTLQGTASPFRIYATINGTDATQSENIARVNPLAFVTPVPNRLTNYALNIVIETTIRRISSTDASVFVTVLENIDYAGRGFLCNTSTVSWNFNATTQVGLFAEILPSGTLTGAINIRSISSWVETYKQS